MNVQLHYSAPQPPASISTGDLVLNSDIGKDVRKFSFRDDLETWQGFEFAIKRVQTGNQMIPYYDIITCPVAEMMTQDDLNDFATTKLSVDFKGKNVGGIIIDPPANKKAYLHSISYSAYDHHQIVPLILQDEDCPPFPVEFYNSYGEAWYARLKKSFYSFGVGKKAYGSEPTDFIYYAKRGKWDAKPDAKKYTTYDFPSLIKPRTGTNRFKHYVAEMLYSNKKAPNSPNHFGMLSQDWAFNKFDIQIKAMDATNNLLQYVWDNRGKRLPTDTNNIAHSYSDDYDEFIPSVWNEINKEIDPNTYLLQVNVQRPYFFVPIQLQYNKLPFEDGVSVTRGLYTPFRLPIKVDISIIYA